MNTFNPNPQPAIIFTDSLDVAKLFNDAKAPPEGGETPTTSVAGVLSNLEPNKVKDYLYMTNTDSGFLQMEYQFMMNGAPRLSMEVFETTDYFEAKLLRSVTKNVVAKTTDPNYDGKLIVPDTTFFVAFGLGDDIDYWSSMQSFQLIGAESYSSFDKARIIKLDFVANLALSEFSREGLSTFIDTSLLTKGNITIAEKFKKKGINDEDANPLSDPSKNNEYTKERRRFRQNNFPNYIAALDNLVDKAIQTIYNTDNVLVVNFTEPYPRIASIKEILKLPADLSSINLEEAYDHIVKVANNPPTRRTRTAKNPDLRKINTFRNILQDLYKPFNVCVTTTTLDAESKRPIAEVIDKDVKADGLKRLASFGIHLNGEKESGITKEFLKSIVQGFLSGYGQLNRTKDFMITRENDMQVLAAVDKAIKKQFGGKSHFDPNRPLIIVGSKELVANYFYGQAYDLRDRTSPWAEPQEDVLKLMEHRGKIVYNLYNSQKVNDTSLASLLKQRDAALNDLIEAQNYPVFKYNTQNATVKSITVNDNRAYLNMLKQSYSLVRNYATIKSTIVTDPSKALVTKYEEGDSEAVKREIKENQKKSFLYKLYNSTEDQRLDMLIELTQEDGSDAGDILNSIIKQELKNNPTEDLVKKLSSDKSPREKKLSILKEDIDESLLKKEADTFREYVTGKNGLITTVEGGYVNDPVKFYIDQLSIIDQATFQIEIETLPYFPISSAGFMQIPCLLFAQRPGFVGDTKGKNPIDSISGVYNLLGFYHRIDTTKAESKFKLFSLPKKSSK